MSNSIVKECRTLIKEFLIKEESTAWRIRPNLEQAIKSGDWSGFTAVAVDYARRLRLNKSNNTGIIALQLASGVDDQVDVDITKNFYEIDKTAKDKKDVIKIITTNGESIPIVKFKKAGQFSKSKKPSELIANGNLNPFIAEWAVAYVICSKNTNAKELMDYFEEIPKIDNRLKPYLDANTGIFKPGEQGRKDLFDIFSQMVENSYEPFEDAGIETGIGKNQVKPNIENTTAAIDIEYERNNVRHTIHVKFDEKKRIGGIRNKEAQGGEENLDDEILTDLDSALKDLKSPNMPVKKLAADSEARAAYFAAVTVGNTLTVIAKRIKSIIFHGGAGESLQNNTFNAIINYSKKLEPSVTVLAKPTERFRQILNTINFVVEPDLEGKTVYLFKVKANVEKETIDDVLKIEIRNDRVPQLHMSTNWKEFYSIIKDKIKDVNSSSVSETLSLIKELIVEAPNPDERFSRVTVGDMKKALAYAKGKKTSELVASATKKAGEKALAGGAKAILNLIPGAGSVAQAIETGLEIKDIYDAAKEASPKAKKSNPLWDRLTIDPDKAAIIDDEVEERFISDLNNRIQKLPDDEEIPDADRQLDFWLSNKYTGSKIVKQTKNESREQKEAKSLLRELFNFNRSAASLPQEEQDVSAGEPFDPSKFVATALAPLDLPTSTKSIISKHVDKARKEVMTWLDNHEDYRELAKQQDTHAIKEKLVPVFKTRQKRIDDLTLKQTTQGTPQRKDDPTLKQARLPAEPIKSLLAIIDNRILKRISNPKTTTAQLPADAQIAIIAATLIAIVNSPEPVAEE